MSARLKEIMKIISSQSIKCVSFDMFDTLVQRPVLYPEDIFILMAKIIGVDFFKQRRIQAAKRAYLFIDYDKKCVSIDDIYRNYQIMFGTTSEETMRMINLEKELEYKLVYVRKSIKRLYDYAKSFVKNM